MIRVLLLSFKDSSNFGDQIIEACTRNLLTSVLGQLNIKRYVLESEDLSGIDSESIPSFNIIVFGGGGLIKYERQEFHERIPAIVNIAERHKIPVIFAGVGVESFDSSDERCIRLKRALNSDCIVQITTRDDLESLKLYITNEEIKTAKVLDSALFTKYIYNKEKKANSQRIGLNVVRSSLFRAYGKSWDEDDEVEFWKGVVSLLEDKGLPYTFFTNGLFSDEMFIRRLQKELTLDDEQVMFGINDQDMLIDAISSFRGVIAFRLHASVISYSLGIPSVGLIWNDKVSFFYKSINYPNRALPFSLWKPEEVVAALESALVEGIDSKEGISPSLQDTYESLYEGVKDALQVLVQYKLISLKTPESSKPDYAQALDDLIGSEKKLKPEERYERAALKLNEMGKHYFRLQQRLSKRKK